MRYRNGDRLGKMVVMPSPRLALIGVLLTAHRVLPLLAPICAEETPQRVLRTFLDHYHHDCTERSISTVPHTTKWRSEMTSIAKCESAAAFSCTSTSPGRYAAHSEL